VRVVKRPTRGGGRALSVKKGRLVVKQGSGNRVKSTKQSLLCWLPFYPQMQCPAALWSFDQAHTTLDAKVFIINFLRTKFAHEACAWSKDQSAAELHTVSFYNTNF
jgi:hypothetical protein